MRDIEFFNGEDTKAYTSKKAQALRAEVSAMSDIDICTCDFDEWINYLWEKYSISPIVLYEEGISQALHEVKVQQYNPFSRHFPYEKEYYEVDGYRIIYTIPFDGDVKLWHLQPSYRILTVFRIDELTSPHREKLGSISLSFEHTKREMEEKGDKLPEYLLSQFESEFKNYRAMIEHVNNEIEAYNKGLKDFARKALTERKEKAESLARISKILEIPLTRSSTAPSATPVAIKRVARSVPRKPGRKEIPKEYAITENDYENINNILYSYGTTMEKTARTYIQNNEEELRDHLLAALNTHYDNATGETFRKIGKTDIHIEFENKAAFVGECKVWHGEKLFSDAVSQLLSYSTWRDLKVSLIIFNKENQNFRSVLSKIGSWVDANTKRFEKKKENLWVCEYYRDDMDTCISLTIIAIDLYVDRNQIKDRRL